uniref:Protein kinase domain-containing protein n=1 Tax=Anopheles minimus TaxID=112268 RepID=A0A182VUC7_9DIPT
SPGTSVYFSVSKLRLTLPISKESYIILRNEPIVSLQLLSTGSELRTNAIDQQQQQHQDGYSYAIESPPDTEYLKVDSRTGALWITSQIYTLSNVTEFVIVAVNSSVGSPFAHGVMPAARLTLTIDPVPVAEDSLDSFCEHHPERACFWDTAQYRVAENGPLGWTIGAVGPAFYLRLCPQHRPKYELLVSPPGNSKEYLLLDPNEGTLRTKVSFDHDTHAPGPILQAGVRCTLQQLPSVVTDVKATKAESQIVDRTITVNVLDRNDNLPRLEQLNDTDSSIHNGEQDDIPSYQVYVDDPHVNQGDTVGYFRIMFTDDDSIPVNTRVHYKLHGDIMELFHPDCAMYENEHAGGLKQTVFGCTPNHANSSRWNNGHCFRSVELIFARSGILRKSPYCVTLQAVDQTVELSPYDTVRAAALFANASVCLTTNLNRIHEYDMPRPEALTSSGIVHAPPYGEGSGYRGEPKAGRKKSKKEANPAKIVYPKEAVVYDTSRKYARIAEPKSFKQLIQENNADLNFRLTSNPLNAFGITKLAGIIYLKNETAFQNKPESRHEITVAWKNYSVNILVRLRKNPNVHCSPVPIEHVAEDFCAAHPNRTTCESACGLGSLMGPCEYRAPGTSVFDEPKPVAWTEDYPTCSSGLSHCPDGICDPLEEMGHREKIHICPQDCVFKQDIFGVHHSDKPRGIQTASGHCSCRASGHCSCIDTLRIPSSYKRNKTITTTSSSTSTTTTTPANLVGVSGSDVELVLTSGKNHSEGKIASGGTLREPSDRTEDAPPAAVRDGTFYDPGLIKGPHASLYLIAIVLIPMVVAVMIVLYCFSRKLTVKNKLLNGSGANGTTGGMTSISMNLVSNDTEIFNVELPLTTRLNEFNFKIDYDSKWEFPRSSLILDATLGEGEFGKVLKGFATDLPEKPGITTVAVKMLKTGANSVELLALLSEYQLLQEVNHPNVIRLLGACTKGDTPLLIIEYCQYGSLKNYLRLSRKLEVLNADYENAVEPITVKDILSYGIVRSCWADDPKQRPSFKHLAGQFEHLLGRSAKYIDMEQNSISNPVYCVNVDEVDCAKMAICKEEQDRLESLWTPPQYETVDTTSTDHTGRYQTPSAMAVTAVISELSEDKKQLLLQSYDTPRPLIETATIEQKLRYENDVRLRPKKLSNASGSSSSSNEDPHHHNHHVHRSCGGVGRSSSISPPRCLRNHFEETSFITSTPIQADRDTTSSGSGSNGSSEYDSPSRQPRRVVSYVDMNKNNRHVNANLEINNMIDKKQSKDIALRFSNVDNELQMVLVDPISGVASIQSCPKSVSMETPLALPNEALVPEHKIANTGNAEVPVEYAEVMKKHTTNEKEPVGLTLTSTV